MPTTGTNIVGPSSSFDQSDWYKANPSFLNGKKNVYLSWTSKSDVSDTNNSVGGVGQVAVSAAMFYRHNTGNSAAPAAWLIGYTFSDRSVQYKSGANTGADNSQQRIAFQIRDGAAPQMWIDGVLQTPNAITQDPTGSGYPTGGLIIQAADELWIGRAVHGLWDGLIDEFRIIEQTVDTNYALTEFRNLNNIDDFVVFGDVETPSSALSPRGELILAETTPGTKVRIKVDTLVVNPNPSSVVLSSVSVPTVGTAVKIDDAHVDFTPTSALGTSRFTVTFTSGGKSVTVPVVVNVSGSVSVRPPDITDISLLSDRVAWTYTEPPGFEGYQPREGGDTATWATATNVGAKTTNKYVMKSGLLTPSKKVLVKPYAGGLEALNAAEISLVEVPVTPGQYYSSPNYGSKTRNDVGKREELMNAIAGIKTDEAYINMTYTESTATTINRGGTATHPLIITAQAPNGLTNFTGRPGFTGKVTMVGDYLWLDRLAIRRSADEAISIQKNWKFITRCLIDAGEGVSISENSNANEWWIGFNELKGTANGSLQGLIHIDARGSGSGRPKNGRIYYNSFGGGTDNSFEQYAIHSGPGSPLGDPNKEYGGYNVDGTWMHYNYINTPQRWAVYLKHGMEVKYNHVVAGQQHGISTRGECVSRCNISFNRVTTQQMSLQGWHHTVIGNICTAEGIKLGCEFRNSPSTPKFTRGSMHALVVGNQSDLIIGEGRYFGDPSNPVFYAPLHDVLIEKHLGRFMKWNDTESESSTQIFPDSNNKLPESAQWRGKGQFYDNDSIIIKNTTTHVLETVPTLNTTVCGPGSDRGKVWGT